MAQFNFCGPSYTSQSVTADAERCLNLYVESIEGTGKSQLALYPHCGLSTYLNLSSLPPVFPAPLVPTIRGMITQTTGSLSPFLPLGQQTQSIGIWGQFVVNLDNTKATNSISVQAGVLLADDGNPVLMTANGVLAQVLIISGGQAFGYTGTTLAGPFVIGGNPIIGVAFLDGFFIALDTNGHIWASAPNNMATWPGTSFTVPNTINTFPVAITVNQGYLWVFGSNQSVIYYDSGNSPFPLDVVAGSRMEVGCAAPQSVATMDNTVFWIGLDSRGQAIVWRANGFTPQRVSNHAVEFAMQGYSQIIDAVAYSFQDQGHTFYQVRFPSANSGRGATWVYDVATGSWNERCFLNPVDGQEYAHRSTNHIFNPTACLAFAGGGTEQFGPKRLVSDWNSAAGGVVYEMKIPTFNATSGQWDFATDFGNPIKKLRRAPVVNIEQEWMNYWELAIDVETGLGPIPPLAGPSTSQPVAYLADSSGVIWAVTITDGGALTRTSGGAGPAESIIINDSTSNTISWQLGITTGGVLTATSVPYLRFYPQTFQMATSGTLLQSGIQITSGGAISAATPAAASRDPQIMLRFSKDNSHTWSNSFNLGAGQAGNYLKRVVHRRMGRARQMTFEVSSTDPIPYRFVNAYLKATAYGPEERLTRKLAKSA